MEVNTTSSETDVTIPVKHLIVVEGTLNGESARILKEDGCNTNVVSRDFYAAHSDLFEVRESPIVVSHSKKGTTEQSSLVIMKATVEMGGTGIVPIGLLRNRVMTYYWECHGTFTAISRLITLLERSW